MKRKTVLNYDAKADVLYIAAKKGNEEGFVEITPGVNIELDERGEVIGIEILNASRFLKPVVHSLLEHKHLQPVS